MLLKLFRTLTMRVAQISADCCHGPWVLCSAPSRRHLRHWSSLHSIKDARKILHPLHHLDRGWSVVRATQDDESPVDIDSLVRQLSREAEKLRKELAAQEKGSSQQSGTSVGKQPPQRSTQGPFKYESKQQETAVLGEVGPGGFSMQDIELVQQLGRLSWVTESAREDPLQVSRNTVEQQTAVIAFKGQYYSGLPFQDPVPVLLKEFLPGARLVACNELQTLVHLAEGLPGSKWHAAREAMSASLPIVPLLGYFWGSQSKSGAAMSAEEEKVLWLVYKFEKLQPLTYYAAAAQSQPTSGIGLWGTRSTEEDELRERCRMVRTICRGMLQALSFCHKRGVAHGSFGPGSVMLSTFRDCQARELIVKLDNFGFAQMQKTSAPGALYPSPQGLDPDHPISLAQQEDLKAAGLVVLETIICALAGGGHSDATSSAALQRLLFDVFGSDVQAFRKHCNQEQDWTLAAALLDEYNGWQLVTDLISGQRSAQECLVNPLVFGV